jgi:hypothetical protein
MVRPPGSVDLFNPLVNFVLRRRFRNGKMPSASPTLHTRSGVLSTVRVSMAAHHEISDHISIWSAARSILLLYCLTAQYAVI